MTKKQDYKRDDAFFVVTQDTQLVWRTHLQDSANLSVTTVNIARSRPLRHRSGHWLIQGQSLPK